MQPKLEIQYDYTAEQLDDLADLCEYWKRNRERGRTARAIRSALIMTCRDISMQVEANERECIKRAVLGKRSEEPK